MVRYSIGLFLAAAAVVAFAFAAPPASKGTPAPQPLRLYVFDCGTLHVADVGRFQLKKEEVSTTDLSVACYLIVHPKGTLIWDTVQSRFCVDTHRKSRRRNILFSRMGRLAMSSCASPCSRN